MGLRSSGVKHSMGRGGLGSKGELDPLSTQSWLSLSCLFPRAHVGVLVWWGGPCRAGDPQKSCHFLGGQAQHNRKLEGMGKEERTPQLGGVVERSPCVAVCLAWMSKEMRGSGRGG